jgi:flagellar motor switch/type III secretory pathway protein FliN
MTASDVLQRFEELPFDLELELGGLVMTIGEIFELREGAILRTSHPAGAPFILRAGGAELAMAQIVIMNNSLSARIQRLMERTKVSAGADGSI